MIRIDKYTNIDRGADPTKEYYINQNGTYLSLTKAELEKIASDLKLLGIGAVSGRSEQLKKFLHYVANASAYADRNKMNREAEELLNKLF